MWKLTGKRFCIAFPYVDACFYGFKWSLLGLDMKFDALLLKIAKPEATNVSLNREVSNCWFVVNARATGFVFYSTR